jgi:hypothetical protein
MTTKKYEHWLDDPANVRRVWRGFLVVLALTVLAEALVTLHPHFEIEKMFGFSAAYGFVTCLLMIVFAKALGLFLKRPDTYYDHETQQEKSGEKAE